MRRMVRVMDCAVIRPIASSCPNMEGATHGVQETGRDWSAGLLLQGKRDYSGVRIDTTMLNAFSLNDIDAKWMVAGLVTLGAAAAVAYKDKKTTNELQQQQAAGGGSPAAPCPRPPSDPCKK